MVMIKFIFISDGTNKTFTLNCTFPSLIYLENTTKSSFSFYIVRLNKEKSYSLFVQGILSIPIIILAALPA